jgi:hypothetical protein
MIDFDDLRKRVERHEPFNIADPTEKDPLIRDLWRAVQELYENGLRNPHRPQGDVDLSEDIVDGYDTPGWPQFEPVTAEELDACIDGSSLGGDGADIIKQLGPLYRQSKPHD